MSIDTLPPHLTLVFSRFAVKPDIESVLLTFETSSSYGTWLGPWFKLVVTVKFDRVPEISVSSNDSYRKQPNLLILIDNLRITADNILKINDIISWNLPMKVARQQTGVFSDLFKDCDESILMDTISTNNNSKTGTPGGIKDNLNKDKIH